MVRASGSPFGVRLRRWRLQRGLSQLALAGRAGSTSRHISFLETGRSRPTRPTVLRLAAALDVGLRECNQLLHAAGLPAAYPHGGIEDGGLAPYRVALERMLALHEPYPAMVLDGHWNVVLANRASTVLFGPGLVGRNFVRHALAEPLVASMVMNWSEVAWAGLDRLRRQRERAPSDPELADLIATAEAALAGVARPAVDPSLLLCPCFRIDGRDIRTITMVARFDAAADVSLDELRVELMYPLDAAADEFFRDRARHA